MKRSIWILSFAMFIQAVPSWGQSGSVFRDGKEWLQPIDFTGYSYDQVSAVCPGGPCSGTLPGSSFDLSGYTWASIMDVSGLFNAYGVNPPFTEPFQSRSDDVPAVAFSKDFEATGTWCFGDCPADFVVVYGMVRNQAAHEIQPYKAAAFVGVDVLGFSNTSHLGEIDFQPPDDGIGAWFFRQVEDPPPIPQEDFIVNLEEPIKWETHSGIGSIRGWAISEDGIDRVEIYIDGEYAFDAPFGGARTDVADQFPEFPNSDQSGFSLAFGYSNLDIGEHTVTARAYTLLGESKESTSAFEVEAFHKDFINSWDIVDLSRAGGDGSEIRLGDVWIDGKLYNLLLKWRGAEQGFEIVDIEREFSP